MISFPDPSNPVFWVACAGIIYVMLISPNLGRIGAALSGLWAMLPGLPSIPSVPTKVARITASQAFADITAINDFLANCKDDPNYKLVVAALKTLET